jgi:hypothetical protein
MVQNCKWVRKISRFFAHRCLRMPSFRKATKTCQRQERNPYHHYIHTRTIACFWSPIFPSYAITVHPQGCRTLVALFWAHDVRIPWGGGNGLTNQNPPLAISVYPPLPAPSHMPLTWHSGTEVVTSGLNLYCFLKMALMLWLATARYSDGRYSNNEKN